MRSTGNDIVALRPDDKLRTARPAFFSKILTAEELALYHDTLSAEIPFEQYVWLLWSGKESVYKYLKRNTPDLEFLPTGIEIKCLKKPVLHAVHESTDWKCTDKAEEFYRGKIAFGSDVFYYRSKISQYCIATVVNHDEDFKDVHWGISSIDDHSYNQQSEAARTLVLKKLNFFYPKDLRIEKSPIGYPVIWQGTQNLEIPVSLAHDGCYVAYSFLTPPQNII